MYSLNLRATLSAIILAIISHICMADSNVLRDITLNADETKIIAPECGLGRCTVEIRAAIAGNRNSNGVGKATWGVMWLDSIGNPLMCASIKWGNENLGDSFDRRYLRFTIDSISPTGQQIELFHNDFTQSMNLYSGANTLCIDTRHGDISFSIGDKRTVYAGHSKLPDHAMAMQIVTNKKLSINYLAWQAEASPAQLLAPIDYSNDTLNQLLGNANTSIIAKWQFLDRDTDSRWAELGGKYTLAVIPHGVIHYPIYTESETDEPPLYDIVLLNGATVNNSQWHTGMLKGALYSTIFENHYTLLWYDAMMESMGDETTADITDNAILTLNFPLYHSKIRLSKVR